MQITVTEEFYHNLRVVPDGELKDFKVMDEVRRGLQDQEDPIKTTCDVIKTFHGAGIGSSETLREVTKAMAGSDKALRRIASDSERASQVNSATAKMGNASELINAGVTCATMDTPFLRYFITDCQTLHPDVYAYIQENIEEYPYFKQISEQIGGTHFTLIADFNNIDPLFGLDCNNLPNDNIRTSARMVRALFFKLFIPIYGSLEDAQSLLDCLFIRSMPVEENNVFYNPNYKGRGPIAHGNNYAMDVFHLDRAIGAVGPIYGELFKLFSDRLRLLNHIFPVKFLVNFEHKIYEVKVEDSLLNVDRLNRSVERRIMTNERSLGSDQENFDKEGDSKGKDKE